MLLSPPFDLIFFFEYVKYFRIPSQSITAKYIQNGLMSIPALPLNLSLFFPLFLPLIYPSCVSFWKYEKVCVSLCLCVCVCISISSPSLLKGWYTIYTISQVIFSFLQPIYPVYHSTEVYRDIPHSFLWHLVFRCVDFSHCIQPFPYWWIFGLFPISYHYK